MTFKRKLMCMFGFHGPYGGEGYLPSKENASLGPFRRTCLHCGSVWHGYEVVTKTRRTVAWDKVN